MWPCRQAARSQQSWQRVVSAGLLLRGQAVTKASCQRVRWQETRYLASDSTGRRNVGKCTQLCLDVVHQAARFAGHVGVCMVSGCEVACGMLFCGGVALKGTLRELTYSHSLVQFQPVAFVSYTSLLIDRPIGIAASMACIVRQAARMQINPPKSRPLALPSQKSWRHSVTCRLDAEHGFSPACVQLRTSQCTRHSRCALSCFGRRLKDVRHRLSTLLAALGLAPGHGIAQEPHDEHSQTRAEQCACQVGLRVPPDRLHVHRCLQSMEQQMR